MEGEGRDLGCAFFLSQSENLLPKYFIFACEIGSSAKYNRSRNRVVWRMVPMGAGQRLVSAFEWLSGTKGSFTL
jgi:hypothetical protein